MQVPWANEGAAVDGCFLALRTLRDAVADDAVEADGGQGQSQQPEGRQDEGESCCGSRISARWRSISPWENTPGFVQPPTYVGTVIVAVFDDSCGNLIQIEEEKRQS